MKQREPIRRENVPTYAGGSIRRHVLRKQMPRLLAENKKLRFKLDVANATPIMGVIVLMILAYVAGYLVGNQ